MTPPPRARAMAALLVTAAVACSRDRTSDRDEARGTRPVFAVPEAASDVHTMDGGAASTDVDAAPEPFSSPVVKLVESGSAPRRRLRYAWNLQARERLSLEMRTSLSGIGGASGSAGIALPSIAIAIDIEPKSTSNDGDLTYAWRVSSAGVDDSARPATAMAEGMRAEVSGVERLAGVCTVSSRGISRDISVNEADDSKVRFQPIAQQVLQTLWNAPAPLPEEEVGLGARWTSTSDLASKGARATQVDSFTLRRLDDRSGDLDDDLGQTAPEQGIAALDERRTAPSRLGSMLASGHARTRFALTRLVPETRFKGTNVMTLAQGDEPKTTTVLQVEIDLSGAVR